MSETTTEQWIKYLLYVLISGGLTIAWHRAFNVKVIHKVATKEDETQ